MGKDRKSKSLNCNWQQIICTAWQVAGARILAPVSFNYLDHIFSKIEGSNMQVILCLHVY
jgi:hypothetical protein